MEGLEEATNKYAEWLKGYEVTVEGVSGTTVMEILNECGARLCDDCPVRDLCDGEVDVPPPCIRWGGRVRCRLKVVVEEVEVVPEPW